ncbi:pyridine nucleotide-disulfide oxidoreductase [Nocardioides marmoriginsengisoli]|uniref:Pyridine nucleotide-disulfide oxidoreductase n=1 Tax=Nocardioides marmoriginsengisoli TaxID=661483 RepID=A0A3N0CJ63_9ACTN|nr:pyridine nucleotide-disulfide oxidoreductase [Nocardioides marmoriginsengisoli]
MTERLLVIGGGAAGMSAASAARRTDPDLPITVLESGPYSSYGVCGIPYYLAGVVANAASLIAHPPSEFIERRRIDLRHGVEAVALDLDQRTLQTSDGETLDFSTLVYAAGAEPIVPPTARTRDPRVVTVRSLADAMVLRARLPEVARAVVVGAGYVGLEVADSLAQRGVSTTVVDRLPRVMPTLDEVIAERVEAEVRKHVELDLGSGLRALQLRTDAVVVELDDHELAADLVVLALGVRPRTGLLADAGLATTQEGALLVNARMQTSHAGVLAAGDSVAHHHRVLDAPAYVPLGPAANKTGRVAGTVAAGGDATFAGVVGTAVVKVFDLEVAHTGLSLEQAMAAGLDAVATDVTAMSRAKYYPDSAALHVRLVHERSRRVLGAQIVGTDGAAKRIDVVAAALHFGSFIDDLAGFDLAYAPPFSPVYDPITQVAQAAQREANRPSAVLGRVGR